MNTGGRYLLDTNVLIGFFGGEKGIVEMVKGWIKEDRIAISVIVMAEFLTKASGEEKEKMKLLVSRFGTLSIDSVIAEVAVDYRSKYSSKSKKVYLLDCLVAATAKVHNLKLVTRNVKDYPMKDIEVINPEDLR